MLPVWQFGAKSLLVMHAWLLFEDNDCSVVLVK